MPTPVREKKPKPTAVQAVVTEQVAPAQETPMPDATTANVEETPEVTPDEAEEMEAAKPKPEADAVGTQVNPLDMLQDDCPTELRALYTDAERAVLRQLYADGKLSRDTRSIEIGEKAPGNPTGQKQVGPYYIYIPVIVDVPQADGSVLYDITAMKALSNGKVAFHNNWPKDAKVDTAAKEAQKLADETWGVVSYYDHGFDLTLRQQVRKVYQDELSGPVGDIAKAVRAMFLLEVEPTKQAAFDAVMKRRIERGQPIVDGLTLEKLAIKWPAGK